MVSSAIRYLLCVLYFSSSFICLVAIVCVIWIYKNNSFLMSNKTYWLILAMLFADTFQIFVRGILTGLFIISNSVYFKILPKLAGALANGCWSFNHLLGLLISLKQFVSLISRQTEKRCFSTVESSRYLLISIFYGTLIFFVDLLPSVNLNFDLERLAWIFEDSEPSKMAQYAQISVELMIALATMIVYMTILFLLLSKVGGKYLAGLNRNLKCLMHIGLLICLKNLTCVILWDILPFANRNGWTQIITNISWVYLTGMIAQA